MCPEVENLASKPDFPEGSVALTFNREFAVQKLSPTSSCRSRAFHAPTQASLVEYDKALTSSEQTVRKALTQLEKTVDTCEAAAEQMRAQQERQNH